MIRSMLIIKLYDILNFCFSISSCDAAESWQLNLQDPATPILEGMLFFS